MQIVVCDDLIKERQTLVEYIHRCGALLGLDYAVVEFERAEDLLAAMHKATVRPDLLFMDIYMDGMTGMAAVKQLREKGFCGEVIFVTTSQSHAVESYDVNSMGYLVKPYTMEKFRKSFLRAVRGCAERLKTIGFLSDRLEFRVFLKDLEYIESAGRGSLVHAKGETLKTAKSISTFAQELCREPSFLRSHQGCVVNLHFVASVEDDHILMKSGAKAPLAIKERTMVKKAATDYFFLKMREEEFLDE